MGKLANWTRDSKRRDFSVKAASGFGMGSTGNRAFDEWRESELARLEEERQKLVAVEHEFAEFMDRGVADDVKRRMRRELAELKEMVRLGAGIPGEEHRIKMIKGLIAR